MSAVASGYKYVSFDRLGLLSPFSTNGPTARPDAAPCGERAGQYAQAQWIL